MISKIVGKRIKNLRFQRGLSQEELANLCGLDRTYITYVENAKKNVTVATLFKITNALGISLSDFFDFDTSEIKTEIRKEDIKMPLVVGNVYTNDDIHREFACQIQGGIRVSNTTKTVVIISNVNNEDHPYNDTLPVDRVFYYTGQGLKGDQEVTQTNRNGKIAYSKTNGYTLHYFIHDGVNRYIYMGEVELLDYHFVNDDDIDGKKRSTVKFKLRLI